MRRILKIAAINAAVLLAVASCMVYAGGAVAVENAMLPPRCAIAKVCPCLAHMQCASISVTASDGVPLGAWYYTPDFPNGKAIILLHGTGSNREDMVALGHLFLRYGYSTLEPDLRGHGESGGFSTYGVLEENDIHAWLDWLEKNGHAPQGIYGFGASLGAAVLLDSLKTETRFRAIVAERSYYDFPSVARERIARLLPPGFQWISTPFVASGLSWVRWHDGIDPRKASPVEGLRGTHVPALLIHGPADPWPRRQQDIAVQFAPAGDCESEGTTLARARFGARRRVEDGVGGI